MVEYCWESRLSILKFSEQIHIEILDMHRTFICTIFPFWIWLFAYTNVEPYPYLFLQPIWGGGGGGGLSPLPPCTKFIFKVLGKVSKPMKGGGKIKISVEFSKNRKFYTSFYLKTSKNFKVSVGGFAPEPPLYCLNVKFALYRMIPFFNHSLL